MKLMNKVAVITGAGSGIGRTTALLFAKEGAKVVVADLNENGGNKTVEAIKKAEGNAALVLTDVSDAYSVKKLVKSVVDMHGRLDILINVAGVFAEGNVVNTSETVWDHVLGVNLSGVYLCMKYCIPVMINSGGGVIVNVASEAGLVAIANQVAYNVSKSGVIALTKSAAIDFVDKNIRVNCICPGRVLTPLVKKVINESKDPDSTRRLLSEDRPLKRMGKPEEIAAGILFLTSDEVKYAIGTVLTIDGGYTVR